MNARAERASERRLVWILASGRSGTTWILNLLLQLPDVDGLDEPLIGAHLGISVGATLGEQISDPRPLHEVSRDRAGYFFSESRRATWEPALRRFIIEVLMDGNRRSKRLLVIKEPNGSAAAPLIMSAFRRSRLLYVVRDGRDVVDSALDAWSDGWATEQLGARIGNSAERTATLATMARHWVNVNRAVQAAFDAHPPDLRMRISYEEVLADTVGWLERMAAWLGRPVPRARLEEITKLLSFESVPEGQRGPGRFARAASPGLWRDHFDADDRAIVDEVMGPMLAEMGYPPTNNG